MFVAPLPLYNDSVFERISQSECVHSQVFVKLHTDDDIILYDIYTRGGVDITPLRYKELISLTNLSMSHKVPVSVVKFLLNNNNLMQGVAVGIIVNNVQHGYLTFDEHISYLEEHFSKATICSILRINRAVYKPYVVEMARMKIRGDDPFLDIYYNSSHLYRCKILAALIDINNFDLAIRIDPDTIVYDIIYGNGEIEGAICSAIERRPKIRDGLAMQKLLTSLLPYRSARPNVLDFVGGKGRAFKKVVAECI